MIIVKSLRGFNVLEGPVGSKWTCQQNAWTENILGVEWIKGVLLAHCEEEGHNSLIERSFNLSVTQEIGWFDDLMTRWVGFQKSLKE
jgi:hypothetical protein